MKQQIKRLEEPSLKCCQLVYDELIRILGQLLAKVVGSSLPLPLWYGSQLDLVSAASIQALSCSPRTLQLCRRQLLQEIDGANYEIGI